MYQSRSKARHCKDHEKFDGSCGDCRFARLVQIDQEENSAPMGRNGGTACDTKKGPCNCGAWH